MGAGALKYGETGAREVALRIVHGQATGAALGAACARGDLDDATIAHCQDGTSWIWSAASTAADATGQLVLLANDTPATGRWLRLDRQLDLKLAVGFGTADAAVLFTVPVGYQLLLTRPLWEVTVGWTGGAASTIGLSSSNAAFSTKGDLLGGAAGDLAAALTVGQGRGAIGTKLANLGAVVLVAGDQVLFNRITSAFTAGSSFAHVPAELLS